MIAALIRVALPPLRPDEADAAEPSVATRQQKSPVTSDVDDWWVGWVGWVAAP